MQNNQIVKEDLPHISYSYASDLIQGLENFIDEDVPLEHYEKLASECQEKAMAIINSQSDAEKAIQSLLNTMVSTSLLTSSPDELIQDCPEDWNQLLQFDYQLLDYCFKEFLNGNQTDLKGHLMMAACQEILNQWNDEYIESQDFSTGQEWFDAYQSFAEQKHKDYLENNYAYFKRWHPAAWHLIELSKN